MLPIFNKHRLDNRLTSDSDFYISVIGQYLLVRSSYISGPKGVKWVHSMLCGLR